MATKGNGMRFVRMSLPLRVLCTVLSLALVGALVPTMGFAWDAEEYEWTEDSQSFTTEEAGDFDDSYGADEAGDVDVDYVLGQMSLDEKISQLIIPAIRTWDGNDVTDLSKVPNLAAALQSHQYGGVILFGPNVVSSEQTAKLVQDLQQNNADAGFSVTVPYLMPVDEEGGVVVRLGMGTRMTGSMAIGATGQNAVANARTTGQVLGEECAALGFNTDFAPSIDVNSNPANPVIGVRSFSDDPQRVGELGAAFNEGLSNAGVITAYKHFPGHGDTGTDSHIGTATVEKTIDELRACDLAPFKQAIDAGADLIMTAHITLPKYDEQQIMADGTKGYFPATMSRKVLTELLRNEMGFNGVIVTDALEMEAIFTGGLVQGSEGSAEYGANIAQKCLDAGVDLLLLPMDLKNANAASYYHAYIQLLMQKVLDGDISEERIDESVRRVLELKRDHGILTGDALMGSEDEADEDAKPETSDLGVVGSAEHHAAEAQMAREAITLLKNEGKVLPIAGKDTKIVLLERDQADNVSMSYVVKALQDQGIIAEDAYVNNLAAGTTAGSPDASTKVTIDYYYDISDADNPKVHYTDELKRAIAEADVVVGMTKNWGVTALQSDNPQYEGMARALSEAHAGGAKFVLLSQNLPYDVARYGDADALVCSYMCSGIDADPTSRQDGSATTGAYNANTIEALQMLFGAYEPTGTLPVNIPAIVEDDKGAVSFDTTQTLYARGEGLSFDEADKVDAQQQTSSTEKSGGIPMLPIVCLVVAAAGAVAAILVRKRRS